MADEVDLEDLMAMLSPAEVQALVDEMAADPDDVHIPASVRYVDGGRRKQSQWISKETAVVFDNNSSPI